MYASIGLHYDFGGESYINGVPQHDEASGFRPAVSLSRAICKFRAKLRYENHCIDPARRTHERVTVPQVVWSTVPILT